MMSRETDAFMRYTVLFAILALAIVGVMLLANCSAEYIREKPVVTDLHKYCLNYPNDSACQGKESK